MKMDNKLYSIGGLKLLVTCLYIGSLEQLENTEKSNGIVQDEPEILMQSTEKIEILFSRIRTSTIDEAEIYGRVLGQILKDLLPPNEILTKVIKELLIMNQSNCVCIATIIHQVKKFKLERIFESLIFNLAGFPFRDRLVLSRFTSGVAHLLAAKLLVLPKQQEIHLVHVAHLPVVNVKSKLIETLPHLTR